MYVHTFVAELKIIHTMKKLTLVTAVAFSALLGSFKSEGQSTWSLDKAHSKLGFTITHLAVSEVDGLFKSFDAKISAKKEDFSDAAVEMNGDVASVNTENEKRDGHLQTAEFFDAAKFPKITFVSTSFKKEKGNTYKVKGNLTMHGVTKPVELEGLCKMGTNPMSNKTIAGFKITGKLKRSEFGIGDKYGAPMLSDEVEIKINAEFAKD